MPGDGAHDQDKKEKKEKKDKKDKKEKKDKKKGSGESSSSSSESEEAVAPSKRMPKLGANAPPSALSAARQRASHRLRDLFDHLENAEATLELLSEQNYMLRIKLLRTMREKTFTEIARVVYAEWVGQLHLGRKNKAVEKIRTQTQERIIQKMMSIFPTTNYMRRACFHGWYKALPGLCEELTLLKEVEEHRKSRGGAPTAVPRLRGGLRRDAPAR